VTAFDPNACTFDFRELSSGVTAYKMDSPIDMQLPFPSTFRHLNITGRRALSTIKCGTFIG
jgi:hypothetical protein